MTETDDEMSEQKPRDEEGSAPADESKDAAPKKSSNPVRSTTIVVLIICAGLLVFHLFSDRYVPRTTQARVNARVVGVAPQVSGIITDVMVEENQFVNEGELLLTIDSTNYELALELAEADLQVARQGTGAKEATVVAAEASVEAAEAALKQAQVEADRMTRIREADPGAISERRVVMAQTALEASKASLNAAEANLEKAQQDLGRSGEENVNILKAESALEQARVNLERTNVYSPGVGLVTGVQIDRGNYAAAGAPLMTYVGVHNLWVQADFTENNLGYIEAGHPVGIVFDIYPGQLFSGTVRSIGYGVDVNTAPLGSLPTIDNDRSWLRDAQRFPVVINMEISEEEGRGLLKIGSQATVVVYTGTRPFMNTLGRLRLRLDSLLTYFY